MAQRDYTSNLIAFPPSDPEIAKRSAKDIPPVFWRASASERMELLNWIGGVCEELLRQHVEGYHGGPER